MMLAMPDGDHFDEHCNKAMVRLIAGRGHGSARVRRELHVVSTHIAKAPRGTIIKLRRRCWIGPREQLAGQGFAGQTLTLGDIRPCSSASRNKRVHRANRRWTGATPRVRRAKQLEQCHNRLHRAVRTEGREFKTVM